ncbi:MAG: 4Fe-4S dicluster domain-containing protein [Candidatus Omnitrophota bacterium]
MSKVRINKKRCKGCHLCLIWCPKKNLKADTVLNEAGVFPAVVIDEENCVGCGMCFVMCPDCCITIEP